MSRGIEKMATLELHVIDMAEENTWSLIGFFRNLQLYPLKRFSPS